MLKLIKNIYGKTKCAVNINNKTTNFFNYDKGVQQGNPLSPLLFNLYINDIFDILKNGGSLNLDNQQNFNALMYADDLIIMSPTLMYADDLIIMSPTKDGLQKSLDALGEFCKKWKLNMNHKKTKCMTFSKGLNTKKDNFTTDTKNNANTKVFKYLGITINYKKCTFRL